MERRTLISYIFLILSSILFLFLIVWPRYYKFLELRAGVSELEKMVASYQEYFKEIENDFAQVKEKEERVRKVQSALPLDPQLPETLDFLQKVASESGLLLTKFSFNLKKSENSNVRELKISLSLSGPYENFKSFLKKVENSSRLFEIENISISSSGKALLNFDLSLKVFFLQSKNEQNADIF